MYLCESFVLFVYLLYKWRVKGGSVAASSCIQDIQLQLALVNDVLLCDANCALTLFNCLPCCAWFFDFSCNVLLCLLLSLYSEVAVRYELPVCCVCLQIKIIYSTSNKQALPF